MEVTIIQIVRLLVALTGTALIGRLGNDRIKLRKTHFVSKAARVRWLMMVSLVSTISLAGYLAFGVEAPVTIASYTAFLNLIAISLGHWYLDSLRPYEESEHAARLNRADKWFNDLIEKENQAPLA